MQGCSAEEIRWQNLRTQVSSVPSSNPMQDTHLASSLTIDGRQVLVLRDGVSNAGGKP